MAPPAFSLEPDPAAAGGSRWLLAGSVTLAEGAELWRELSRVLGGHGDVTVDVARVDRVDGGGAALLAAAAAAHERRGGQVHYVGAGHDTARLLDLYDCGRGRPCARPEPAAPGMLAEIGDGTAEAFQTLRAIFAFVGDLVVGVLAAV